MSKNPDEPATSQEIALDNLPPPDARTLLLTGIFIILLMTVLRYASVIIIPIVLALVLKLVLKPVLRMLRKLYIPNVIASFAIVLMLLGIFVAFGMALSGPASAWADKLPESLPKLQHKLGFISDSMENAQKVMEKAEDITNGSNKKVMPVTLQGTRLSDKFFASTQSFASGTFMTLIILFFLLVSGDTFLRRLVEIVPRFRDKRQVVDISQQIEQDITVYLMTITVMNVLVGISTGIIMWACGIGDPVLWGACAFILNYIPILGPVACMIIFTMSGLVVHEQLFESLLPAALYMLVHFIEGTFVTPLLLARRFTLNPVLIVISLVFWYWMWGFVGAILAVPMLSMIKILCDRVDRLKPIGHFLSANVQPAT